MGRTPIRFNRFINNDMTEFQELEKEFDVVTYAKEKLNATETGKSIADRKMAELKGNQQ
jgi:hypothetical protein